MDGENVRVRERRDGARLALESLAELRVGHRVRRHGLDRDLSLQPRVTRAIHLAHPAMTNRLDDLVRAQPGSWQHCGVGAIVRRASWRVNADICSHDTDVSGQAHIEKAFFPIQDARAASLR